jgi:large subunit ribosomal protein L25
MKSVALNAFPRTLTRRGGVKKLRSSGRIPAVVYGRQDQPQNLEINSKELEDLLHHSASEIILVDLAVKEDKRPKRLALVQQVQHHPLSGKVLHLDLHEVAENEKVVVYVPVETVGEAEGVKTGGGVLSHVMFKVKARALPKDLPSEIVVDVSHLKVNDAVHVGELKSPPGVELLGDKAAPVVSCTIPRAEVEEVAAEAAPMDAGDVEMLKEKKEGEEGEEAPAAKGAAAKPGEKAPAAKPGEKAAAGKAPAGKGAPADDKKAAAPAAEKKPERKK